MFSRHRRLWAWVCCLSASVCLCASLQFLLRYRESGNLYEYAVTTEKFIETSKNYETTSVSSQTTEERITEKRTIDFTVSQTTDLGKDETTKNKIDETMVAGEGHSREESTTVPHQGINEGKNKGFIVAAVILSMTGAFLSILFIFAIRQRTPVLGPEAELLLAVLLIAALDMLNLNKALLLAFQVAVLAALLCIFRGLWGWAGSRFSLGWSANHRIGRLAAKGRVNSGGYLISVIFLSLTLLAGVLILLFSEAGEGYRAYRVCLCLGCLFSLSIGLLLLIRYSKSVDHLTGQISVLNSGGQVNVSQGVFASDEENLARLKEQRDKAIETALVSERFKVDLISNVSHDLRTPLTSILGYSELLKGEKLSEEGQKQLEKLNQKADYMSELVEELFELTKVSSGALKSKRESIDLVRLLEQTIGQYDEQLNMVNLEVRRYYSQNSMMAISDGTMLHQVFANLLGNAIKYALSGTRIYLVVKEREDAYTVRLTNTASYDMDFSPDEIVNRFVRGDKARTTKGSGIGLAIASTYMEAVGGSFRVEVDGDQFAAIAELPKN